MNGVVAPQDSDDSEPTPERQAELRAAYEANVTAGRAPYWDVPTRTRAELRWIVQQRDWSVAGTTDTRRRANFRGADFRQVDLSGQELNGADLSHAHFNWGDLHGIRLRGTRLNDAQFDWANLRSADLREARLDAATDFRGTVFDSTTWLADIGWNGAPLARVDWVEVRARR